MTGLYVVALVLKDNDDETLLFLELMPATSNAEAVSKVESFVLQNLQEQGIDTTYFRVTNSKANLLGHY